MTQAIDKKEQIWLTVFVVIPIVVLVQLNKEFTDSSTNRILFAGIFGALGGLFGGVTYRFVKDKHSTVKSFTLLGLFIFCLGILILPPKLIKPRLVTCEICGYKAINPDSSECNVCGNSAWEKNNSIYDSKSQWIKEEQLFWFSIDSTNQKVEFFQPDKIEEYEKDKNWKPTVTEQEVRDYFSTEK